MAPELPVSARERIDELIVDGARRGEGIGSALLGAALDYAAGIGCKRASLSTRRTRESYQRGFYLLHGFREVDSALMRLEPIPTSSRK